VALALIAAFVAIEARTGTPLVRLSIFRVRALAVGNVSTAFMIAGLYANFFFGTLYVQEILHYTPIAAGFAFLPVAVLIGAGAAAAQRLIPRFGVRAVAIGGIVLGAIGLLLMTRVNVHGTYVGTLLPPFVCLAIGLGIAFVPATLISVSSVEGADAGLASGLYNTAQQIGGALGLAILSTLAVSHTASLLGALGHKPSLSRVAQATVSGYQLAFLVAAGLMLTASIVLVAFLRARDVENVTAETVVTAPSAA
jgi:predicted MFS family arabinose efflux permease